jgi:replicative DNA helicase
MEGLCVSTENFALLRARRMVKFHRYSMSEKQPFLSEGEQLDAVLDGLQAAREIREISGWESGFLNLSRALDGMLPGLYLLIGPPACGKTSFAKQLFDQVIQHNAAHGIFFSFTETKTELRIRTLSRLSDLENKEIRRGSAYLLHWYGVPKTSSTDTAQLPPSWEKLRRSAEQARSWLNRTYLVECNRETDLQQIESQISELTRLKGTDRLIIVIDDCQRLGAGAGPPANRLAAVADQLQSMAKKLHAPVIAVCPNVGDQREALPAAWVDRVPGADVILLMEPGPKEMETLTESTRLIRLHVVKNRGGERGRLAFDFFPAFAKFAETQSR